LAFPDKAVTAMTSLLRATNLWGYPELVRELGGDPGPLLARFHIPPGVEHQDDSFVPFEAVARMLDASAEELGCPDFGLRLCRWQGLDILGPIAVIARNAQTMGEALSSVARYLYVHSPALEFEQVPYAGSGDLRFTFRINELTSYRLRQSYELSMANGVSIIRLLSGGASVSRVSFLHEQMGSEDAYAETLGCPVSFGQGWCGLEISPELASQVIDSADPETRRLATKYLEAEFVPGDGTLAGRVAELARRLLPTGQCTVEVIADELLLHPRTLQRRLREEGSSCQDVIESVRQDLANRYLAEPGFQLGQVAGLLGYSEQSSLNRSCQRWFGTTPRQYRARLRERAHSAPSR
jgi:AraC-like DNA-binding protein